MSVTRKQRILIVDDTPDNIHVLLNCLAGEFAITVATNGEQALQIAGSEPGLDMILLDIMMPGLDGYEVCQRLKNNPATHHIPVIFVTAMADAKDERRGLELGAVDYIYKPFNQTLVKARVLNHLELKKYRDYLEDLVQQRTEALDQANQQLQAELEERKLYEQRLYQQANFDQLTGLPNRNYCQWYFEQRCAQCSSEYASCRDSIILLDIDNLKFVNDTFGHEFGDLLLKAIADRLNTVCGEPNLVSRFVGDKFLVLPRERSTPAAVAETAKQIHAAMNEPFEVRHVELYAKASLGVATCADHTERFATLLKNVETAMYHAKKSGKNCVITYTPTLNMAVQQRLHLETKLHRALERNEFSLHYQPQVDVTSGAIIGVEALLRWTPDGATAPIPPGQFIPLLEELGLVVEVGAWVLREACRQCVLWHQQGLGQLRMSVNISVLQFMRSDIDQVVRSVLEQTGLSPQLLCLELTESMLMQENDKTMAKLLALHKTGVLLSLDDFGTGFSSLEYLGRLPLHELKIDRTFVNRMLITPNDAVVVNTIIAMAKSLDLKLVAEGVETAEQLQHLTQRDCDIIQGFYFSQPLPCEALEALLRQWEAEKQLKPSTET